MDGGGPRETGLGRAAQLGRGDCVISPVKTAVALNRAPTGIQGLDSLIQGGLPRGGVNLVAGPAGSGKSLLALQFAYQGAKTFDEPSAFLALEEERESVERVAALFGMELKEMEDAGKFVLVDLGAIRTDSRDGLT